MSSSLYSSFIPFNYSINYKKRIMIQMRTFQCDLSIMCFYVCLCVDFNHLWLNLLPICVLSIILHLRTFCPHIQKHGIYFHRIDYLFFLLVYQNITTARSLYLSSLFSFYGCFKTALFLGFEWFSHSLHQTAFHWEFKFIKFDQSEWYFALQMPPSSAMFATKGC